MKESVKKEEGKKRRRKGGGRKKKNKHGSIFRFPFTGTHRTCPFRTRLANVPHCARRTLLAVCVAPSRCRTTSAFRWRLHNCMSTYSHAQTKIKGGGGNTTKQTQNQKKKTQFSSGLSHRCENGREGATKKGERRVQCPGVD